MFKLVSETLFEHNIITNNYSTKFYIRENMNQARSVLQKQNIPETDERFQKLKSILASDNKMGYIGIFTKWLYKDNETWEALMEVYSMLKKYKGKIPPITQFKTLEDLYDYIQGSNIEMKVNRAIKAIPSNARKHATEDLRKLIELNIQHVEQIINFYSKKGGKFKDSKTLYNETKALIENLEGEFNNETLKNKIEKENINAEIIHDDEDVMIIRPIDFNASEELGSRSWCITTSQSQWDSYVDLAATQYFIYDFTKPISDKRSMIGITIKVDGSIEAAHFKDDSSVPHNYLNKIL